MVSLSFLYFIRLCFYIVRKTTFQQLLCIIGKVISILGKILLFFLPSLKIISCLWSKEKQNKKWKIHTNRLY